MDAPGGLKTQMQADKVMFLADAYENPYAGTEGQLHELVVGLRARGVEVGLALLRPSAYIDAQGFPCPVEVLGIRRILSFRAVRTLRTFARETHKSGYRIVHLFFNDSSLIAPLLLRLAGLRVVISRRDMGFWYTPIRKWILRFNSRLVDAAVTNSLAVKRETAASEWIPSDRIHVIYNGYKQSAALTRSSEGQYMDLDLAGRTVVIIVANIRPIKRIFDLVDAAALLRRDDICYLVVGGGDLAGLQQRAEQRGVAQQFRLLGARSDVPALLAQSDIAVLCSESEGFSNAIVEYQMAGKPTICTRTGGNPEIIRDSENGFLYDVGDVRHLADLIARLADSRDLAVRMGRAGQSLVADRFDLGRMVAEHMALYGRLLTGRADGRAGPVEAMGRESP